MSQYGGGFSPSLCLLFVLVRPFLNSTPQDEGLLCLAKYTRIDNFVYWNESQSRKEFPSLCRIIAPPNGPFR
jgi:hypothetical protein